MMASWAEFVPFDYFKWIKRGDLIRLLNERGIAVNERILKSWEAKGVLPRPVVAWRDQRPHTWYPPGISETAVVGMLDLKEQGHRLGNIGPLVEDYVRSQLAGEPHKWGIAVQRLAGAIDNFRRVHEDVTGRRAVRIEIRATDDDGDTFVIPYP